MTIEYGKEATLVIPSDLIDNTVRYTPLRLDFKVKISYCPPFVGGTANFYLLRRRTRGRWKR